MDKPALLFSSYNPAAAVTATDSYAGTDPADVLNFNEAHFWRPANISGSKVLSIDLAEVRIIDHLALVGQGLDGVVLTLEGSNDNWTTSETLLDAQLLVSAVNAAWSPLSSRSWRYLRLTFSFFSSAFRVSFISLELSAALDWLDDDFDPDNVSDSGDITMSPGGLCLGAVQQRSMRHLQLIFGQVVQETYDQIQRWANACQKTRAPYFFVPDISTTEVYFGWSDSGQFSAPLRADKGLREVPTVTMITRGV
ncbi:hypothetical protein [Geopsychrobacter electrodiphilus]|uniref:hypothetical protein n=1 Tax=Geopsychrobacter electrodiphilus TaxID=225196 RepID=UPI0003711B5A|nr:hypothetical protein [Geopsychrobacter electrodiphilus]